MSLDHKAIGRWGPRVPVPTNSVTAYRGRPGQNHEGRLLFGGSTPNVQRHIAPYALSPWVYTAVNRIAEACRAAELKVVRRDDATARMDNHGLLEMLGPYGSPNSYTSTREFWHQHFTYYELAGNVFWYWSRAGSGMGPPDEVHLLHPANIRIVPGTTRRVEYYEYRVLGHYYKLSPESIVHFKKPNPFNEYWGLPALEALMVSVIADHSAIEWNREFFGDGVGVPVGIFVIPQSVGDADMKRIEMELNAKHAYQRRTAVVRAEAGETLWHDAGLKPSDMGFEKLREMTRREVYESMGIPLGYLSETSTEAHARVAERQFLHMVYQKLGDVADRLNPEVMQFWPRSGSLAARFADVRREAADWDQQRWKYQAMMPVFTANEIREEMGAETKQGSEWDDVPASFGWKSSGRDTGPVQRERQVPDVVEQDE